MKDMLVWLQGNWAWLVPAAWGLLNMAIRLSGSHESLSGKTLLGLGPDLIKTLQDISAHMNKDKK